MSISLRNYESENKILSRQEILDAYESTHKASSFKIFKNVTAKSFFSYQDMLDDDVFMNKAITVYKDCKPSTMQSYLGHWITYWQIAGLDQQRVLELRIMIRDGIDRGVRTPKPSGYWDLKGDNIALLRHNLPNVPCQWNRNGNPTSSEKESKDIQIPLYSNENPTEDIQQENEEDKDKSGYIYAFSNSSMPGLLKIGMTTHTPEKRLKEANSNTWNLPFYKIEFAKEVCDARYCEKIIHSALKEYREDPNREFFRISTEEMRKIIDKIDDRKWTNVTKKNIEEDPEKIEEQEKRLLNLRSARDAREMRKRHEEEFIMYDKSKIFWLSKPVGGILKNYTLDAINNTGKELDKEEFKTHIMYTLDGIKCTCWMK